MLKTKILSLIGGAFLLGVLPLINLIPFEENKSENYQQESSEKSLYDNNLHWVVEPRYEQSLNKLYGEFTLDSFTLNVFILHSDYSGENTSLVAPQYDTNDQTYSFIATPFTDTSDTYYYGNENIIVSVDGFTVANEQVSLKSFDPSTIIFNFVIAYVSDDTAIITFESDLVLLDWIETKGFEIKMNVNQEETILSYDEIRSGDVVLLNLTPKTAYVVDFYINDPFGDSYLNGSTSFVTT